VFWSGQRGNPQPTEHQPIVVKAPDVIVVPQERVESNQPKNWLEQYKLDTPVLLELSGGLPPSVSKTV
jgi:hypothetical protein